MALTTMMLSVAVYAQEAVTIGTTASFYQSLKSQSGLSKTSAKKVVKTSRSGSIEVVINHNDKKDGAEVFVGKVNGSENSFAFFTFSDGRLTGKVILTEEEEAYEYSSDKNQNVWVKPIHIEEALCVDYASPAPGAEVNAPAPPPGSYVYNLQSLPGATAVVMLDFDGHNAFGSWWGNINALPAENSEEEILEAWKIISEDFRPFDLNITTNEAVYQAAPSNRRMRVIFTPTTDAMPGSGGVAFISSFTFGGEVAPCWVYNLHNGKIMGETGSHEIGHTVGLLHDGRSLPGNVHEEYYGGQDEWAPIMGVSFSPAITQWSRGEYQYANNQQDDIAVIASQNGFGFRPDAQGNSTATAGALVVNGDGSVLESQNYGIIADKQDVDYFSFTTNGGNVTLTVYPTSVWPNLDLLVSLVNQQGTVITSSNPIKISPTQVSATVAAGTYYLVVDGSGYGNPFTDGYSDYSSIGEYTITGTISTKNTGGISGPSCVTPGQPYVFSVSPEQGNYYGITWWVSGDATISPNPNDSRYATVTFSTYNAAAVSISAGVNFTSSPWYKTYTKSVQVNNCTPSQKAGLDVASDVIMTIKVLDLNGREVAIGETKEPEEFASSLTLPSGMYLMYVSDGITSFVHKIVK